MGVPICSNMKPVMSCQGYCLTLQVQVEVGCLVLTIGYSGSITKGLLNEYFFRDIRWVDKNGIVTIN